MKRTLISLCATVALCTAARAANIYWDGAADLAADPTIGATAANPVDLDTATFTNASGAAASPYNSNTICIEAALSPMYVTNSAPVVEGYEGVLSASGQTIKYLDCLRFNSGDFVVLGPIAHMNDLHNNVAGKTASITKRGNWWLKDMRFAAAVSGTTGSTTVFTNEAGALTVRGTMYLGYNHYGKSSFVTTSPDDVSVADWLTIGGAKYTENYFEMSGIGTVSAKGLRMAYNYEGQTSTLVKNSGRLEVSGNSFQLCTKNSTTASFYHHGGSTYLSIAHLQLGATADGTTANMKSLFVIDGGAVTNASTGAYTTAIGNGGDAASTAQMFVTNNGSFYAANYFYVGNRAKGTLTIDDDGIVEVPNQPVVFCNNALCAVGRDCAINLDGGTLLAKQIAYGSGGAAATFSFNGGTLKAASGAGSDFIQKNANLTVTVGARGGAIDTSLASVTIPADVSGTGGLTFKGGNSATVTGSLSYAGATTVELGTTLTVSGRADVFDTGAGLVCRIPAKIEDRETRTLLSTSGDDAFTAADLAKCSASGCGNVKFTLSGDGKSICAKATEGLIISIY